ncbi:hypothetical protein PTSG_12800 [Salpingoeca rosetta]|uniref:TLC domain-containing protein n=1 Tax=Salpingoeca rosetta (strain ATCC 50818 / BSB-021) TaxID=946362 RepID=F2UKU1_SALR5|nr:uncharacterized protein PTSG_12800 [Salpingoeca rosetta]EGD77740.1 hypothetical protein PTSG_12800 [Salpingoeca rosetta]|eukprot:XP_004990216.1 hypothetical protein PTSG_12800 [Salpingoeca rosetta]
MMSIDYQLTGILLAMLLTVRYFVERNKDRYPAAINFFKVFWFLGCSINEYLILFKQPFKPPFFGGEYSVDGYQHDDVVNSIYASGLAFHLHNTITSFFVPETRAMYIHHVVTLSLILGSAYHGATCMGSFVLFVHNVPDVFIALAKASTKFDSKIFTYASGILALVSWPIFRLYFLGHIAIFTYYNFHTTPAALRVYVGLLCALLALHLYWYALLVKIFLSFKASGEALDTSEHVSQQHLQSTMKDKTSKKKKKKTT